MVIQRAQRLRVRETQRALDAHNNSDRGAIRDKPRGKEGFRCAAGVRITNEGSASLSVVRCTEYERAAPARNECKS